MRTQKTYKVILTEELCVGCGACQLACSLARLGKLSPKESLIRLSTDENGEIHLFLAENCDCKINPPCSDLCPASAISIV